jgi:beta-galactosidase
MELGMNSRVVARLPSASHQPLFRSLILYAFTALSLALPGKAEKPNPPHTFAVEGSQFTLDGKPFQIISGEMHYARIPRAYWRQRLRMARAMGLNTISTYVFWNLSEPRPGVYDFTGNNDVAEFIREAQQEGLYVILRPGPYICAEWDFGGYPPWLLKSDSNGDHSLIVRSSDPKYVAIADRWIKRVGEELAPLQIGNGGPILLVQVENEYGSFGADRTYMEHIRQSLLDAGFTKSQLYTADPPEDIANGSLPELPVGIDFNRGARNSAETAFATLKQIRPNGPFFASEFWVGWYDHWGHAHAYSDASTEAANLEWMLRQGYSVNLYMFHGGTSFGFMNGANIVEKNYAPDVTSYDYGAPLDESGRPTPKYFKFRDVIAKVTGVTPSAVPVVAPAIKVAAFKLDESVSLWNALPAPIHSQQPISMEDADESYGYILYRTQIKGPITGDLVLDQLHDYAQIYVDGKLVGELDRRLGENRLPLVLNQSAGQLDILVEGSGRVNDPIDPRDEREGITNQVTLAGVPVVEWNIYPLPMLEPSDLNFSQSSCEGACFYRGTFNIDAPSDTFPDTFPDTFLDTSAFSKGEVWLNGHALGRIWKIGPQKTLYVPGSWLQKGTNTVVVFDLNGEPGRSLAGRDKPILGSTAQLLYSILLSHRRLSILAATLLASFLLLLIGWLAFRQKTNAA